VNARGIRLWWDRLSAAWRNRDGQALVEYALILALVAIAAIAALHFLGQAANNTLQNVANNVNTP
jgi:pilus assembly protein Flp/PilA